MNLNVKNEETNGDDQQNLKRKLKAALEITENVTKKLKTDQNVPADSLDVQNKKSETLNLEDDKAKASQHPKKRLEIERSVSKKPHETTKKEKFIYGNYSKYYSYRSKNFHDVRLDVFATRKELLLHKDVLDIGCNNGFITTAIAKQFIVKSIVGIDIDRSLINQAIKNLVKFKKKLPLNKRKENLYPFNVKYVHGNYVLKDDCLLEIERPQFDVILCLSITKWIQLNFGDAGLKQAFRRMFLQLRSGGVLMLEAQPIENYRKRKNLSEASRINFESMKFYPDQFADYLLSGDVGFKRMELLGVPEHCVNGFKRPIQIFYKDEICT